eukprot:scaffold96697_cov45-Phaeocystis_antarctica.AAC.1
MVPAFPPTSLAHAFPPTSLAHAFPPACGAVAEEMTAAGQGHFVLPGRGASLPLHHSEQVEIDIYSASGPIYTPHSPLMRPKVKATARTEEEEQLRRLAVEVETRDNFYRGRPIK